MGTVALGIAPDRRARAKIFSVLGAHVESLSQGPDAKVAIRITQVDYFIDKPPTLR
jgi:hypothetical protein